MDSDRITEDQYEYMRRAIALARRGEGRTSPNPPVGALIVRAGEVVGEGYHPEAGKPHAEIYALRAAGERARGAEIYVTLEPCSHFGKTPPCADALIKAGIKRVYVGVVDPNPQVAGRGIERLRNAGIEVQVGILETECRNLIRAFSCYIRTGRPYTIYKAAMTLDGNTATAGGESRWISGEESRRRVHRLRDRVDAIMVGVETVCYDDPLLTTRLDSGCGRDPLRVVVDSQLRTPRQSRILQLQTGQTMIATICADQEKHKFFRDHGVDIIQLSGESGRVPLPQLWLELGQRQIQTLLLEGGATLAAAALKAKLIDRLMIFVAPKVFGGVTNHGIFNGPGCLAMAEAHLVEQLQIEQSGADVLLMGELEPCLPG